MDWIYMAEDSGNWWTGVKTVMRFWVA